MAIKLTQREQVVIGASAILLAGFLGWTGIGCFTGVEIAIKNLQKVYIEFSTFQAGKKAAEEDGKRLDNEIAQYSVSRPKPPGIIISKVDPDNPSETREMLVRKILDEIMTIAKKHSLELVFYVPEDINLAPPPQAPESAATTPSPVPAPKPNENPPLPQGKPILPQQPGTPPDPNQPPPPPPPSIADYIDQIPYKVELRGDYKDINGFVQDMNRGLKVFKGTTTLGNRVFGIRSINMEINNNVDTSDQRSKKALKLTLFLNIVLCKSNAC